MTHRSVLAVAIAAISLAGLPTSAHAATSFRQNALSVKVAGTTATVTANVGAVPRQRVDAYGLCATDSSGAAVGFGERPAAVIPSTGLTTRATVDLPAGTYQVGPCVTASGVTTNVGSPKTLTVVAASPKVLFDDEFDGSAGAKPDASRWGEWSACTYNGSAAYGNIGCGERATLDGSGHLVIPATPTQGTSISTKDHFSFTTGVLEARVYLQGNRTGPGYWPAVWTLNNNPAGNDADVLGEADLLEAYTGLAEYAHVSTHNWNTRNGSDTWSANQDPACGQGQIFDTWVTVKAVFEADKITFFYNGTPCGTAHLRSEQPNKPYGFAPDVTRGNWPILTLAVGGAGGQQDGRAVGPGQLLVDYVRVTSL